MDLYAYTQIVDLGKIAERNGISVPRCRGYRLMKIEQRVTAAEIEQMIHDQALYEAEKLFRLHPSGLFYEYSDRAKARARRYIVIQKNDNLLLPGKQDEWLAVKFALCVLERLNKARHTLGFSFVKRHVTHR